MALSLTLPLRVPDTQPPEPAEVVLRVTDLTKRYHPAAPPALSALSLSVSKGELLAVLGPSGCGKTTLLRLLAGFEKPDAGRIQMGEREVAGSQWLEPERRGIGFVFQDYALFPHLTVSQNVAFGLGGRSRKARRERTDEILDLVGLRVFAARYPHQLSGGQQQRVALARALAPKPALMLLDEPFSNLDAALRSSTRNEVRRLLKEAGVTTILVTHDQEEAMSFAERLMLLRAGELEQVGTPERVYAQPRTAFAASFLGTTNLLRGEAAGRRVKTVVGWLELTQPAQGQVLVSLRPEDLCFTPSGLPARIITRDFKGHDLTYTCEVSGAPGEAKRLIVHTTAECPYAAGDEVYLAAQGRAVPLQGPS